MIAALDRVDAVAGVVALFVLVVAVLTFARIVLKREALSWARLRVGFFVERDRSEHEREREPEQYDWDPPPEEPR